MTDEERQRTMDFILQQQAKFSVDMESLRESQAELREAQARTQQQIDRTQQQLDQVAQQQVHMNSVVASIADYQQQLAAAQEESRRAHAETGERLNAVINMVERYIAERGNRNGRSDNAG